MNPTPVSSTEYRQAQQWEIDAALRVLIAGTAGRASDGQVRDFHAFAADRGIELSRIWIAISDGVVRWSILPVPSPGRTMLLFTPSRIGRTPDVDRFVRPLVDAMSTDYLSRGVHLAQLLIDPSDAAVVQLYKQCGFDRLAELIYLQRHLRRGGDLPPTPDGFVLETYCSRTHGLFAQAIQQSYASSLDCPGLNGQRDIEDVIAGHRHAGEFDPSLWYLLSENSRPAGVLLLSPSRHSGSGAIELVYLGLAPSARGRGVGDWFMKLALSRASQYTAGRGILTLAVDSQNRPALNLYYRHGLARVGSRIALLRDLRRISR
jgi:ribosomal protein S18 acetylase RimI-like enzyme